ncbi:MAG: hypothetical protein B7733_09940 [Myxococcales bacterium FL481]|nr:MAG: hypothetical protein B7733_09940 [Myxococcales bacterium FL481]
MIPPRIGCAFAVFVLASGGCSNTGEGSVEAPESSSKTATPDAAAPADSTPPAAIDAPVAPAPAETAAQPQGTPAPTRTDPVAVQPGAPQPTRPGAGQQTLDQPCDGNKRCIDGLGCSGLYRTTPGTCIADAQAKAKCEARGDAWGTWGMMRATYCMPVLPDADKPCTDDAECQGNCIAPGRQARAGKCQRLEVKFGCYQTMAQGKPTQTRCVD